MTAEKLKELLKGMTLEEKAGQLTQVNAGEFVDTQMEITGPDGEVLDRDQALARAGSVLTFENAQQARQLQDLHLARDPKKIPLLLMLDVIHGYRTVYPIPLAMGCGFDDALMAECADMARRESAAGGLHVTFNPMVDTAWDARWGRIMETCSEEPLVNGRMGAAQVRAWQTEQLSDPEAVAACVKHFAGYGAATAGKDYSEVEMSERLLREAYLPAYQACVDAGVRLVMPSFNALNGIPSIANQWLMNRVLRGEWGFRGVVISDYNAIGELLTHGVAETPSEAAELAAKAGCDIDMVSGCYFRALPELVRQGRVPEEALDEAVMRVLELKNDLGLFENPYHGADPEKEKRLCLCSEHRVLALKAAEKTAVLLKNDGLLPLGPEIRRVALIGPYADEHAINGFWSCHGRAEDTVSVAEAVGRLHPEVTAVTVRGCGAELEDSDESGIPAAVQAAREADAVILCLGEPEGMSGEGRSRSDLHLPGMQELLARRVAEANPKTVAVLFNGRPLVLTEIAGTAAAVLEMWYPGTEGGTAAVRLLWGEANPSGRLSFSMPRSVGQYPYTYRHPSSGRPKPEPDSRYYPFTNCYMDVPNSPLYPFGYGLSYTRFEYESLTADKTAFRKGETLRVTASVKDAGDRAGEETVQLYLRDEKASVVRPVQQLIDYRKLRLEPGERAEVSFTVTEEQLRFCGFEGRWISEPGFFRLSVGWADHPLQSLRFELLP